MSYSGKNPKFRSVVFPDEGATSLSNAPTGAHRIINRNGKLWLKDSAGTETQLGSSGSGGKNYVTNPSAAADTTGWAASGSGVTLARTTTAAELPRAQTTGTGFKLTGVSGTDYARARFTIDEADKGRVLAVILALRTLTGYTNGDFKVEVYSQAASDYSGSYTELALSTDVSGTSGINAGTTLFGTTFAATTADYYEVRIVRVAGTAAIGFSDVKVTPDQAAQGAAIEPWKSYTPTGSWVSNATYTGRYRRVGDTMELSIKIALSGAPTAASLTVDLPSGFTIDTSKMDAEVPNRALGVVSAFDANGESYSGEVGYVDSNTLGAFDHYAAATYVYNGNPFNATAPFTFASGDAVYIRASVPITEWAQSGTVNLIKQDNLKNWTDYTPTFTGWGTTSSASVKYKRIGADLYIKVAFTSGTLTATNQLLSLPSGLTVDTTQVGSQAVPIGVVGSSGNTSALYALIKSTDTGNIGFAVSTNAFQTLTSGTFSSTVITGMIGPIPIAEWANQNNTSLCGFLMADASGNAGLVNPYTVGAGVIYTGTYTPTVTSLSGFSALSNTAATYMRVGNLVTVSGQFTGTATAGGFNAVSVTLPIARAAVNTAATVSGTAVFDRAASSISIPLSVTHNAVGNGSASASLVYVAAGSGSFTAASGLVNYTFSYLLA